MVIETSYYTYFPPHCENCFDKQKIYDKLIKDTKDIIDLGYVPNRPKAQFIAIHDYLTNEPALVGNKRDIDFT